MLEREEKEDDDLCSVFSTKEDLKNEGKFLSNSRQGEDLGQLELVTIEEDVPVHNHYCNQEIEEILQISLADVNVVEGTEDGYSLWIAQNVQKFSNLFGVSLEGMEALTYFYFSELEKKKLA